LRLRVERRVDVVVRAVLPVIGAGLAVRGAIAVDRGVVIERREQCLRVVLRSGRLARDWRCRCERSDQQQCEGAQPCVLHRSTVVASGSWRSEKRRLERMPCHQRGVTMTNGTDGAQEERGGVPSRAVSAAVPAKVSLLPPAIDNVSCGCLPCTSRVSVKVPCRVLPAAASNAASAGSLQAMRVEAKLPKVSLPPAIEK